MTALHLANKATLIDIRDLGLGGFEEGWVADSGIREVDVLTGETVFEWWPSDWVNPTESHYNHEYKFTSMNTAWNWMSVCCPDSWSYSPLEVFANYYQSSKLRRQER